MLSRWETYFIYRYRIMVNIFGFDPKDVDSNSASGAIKKLFLKNFKKVLDKWFNLWFN